MKSSSMDKIPVPVSLRWKEIRVRFFPFLVFLGVSLVVAWLWRDRVDATNLVGQVVGNQAEVRSPRPGSLADLTVRPFDHVGAGDPLGKVITTDPGVLEAELAVVLAEIELVRLTMDPLADPQRNLLNYESLRMDLMEQQARKGVTEIRKEQAGREYQRVRRLHDAGLASDEMLDLARTEHLALSEELSGLNELTNRLQKRLDAFGLDKVVELWEKEDPRAAAIAVQQRRIDRIKAEMMPVVLRAPVSGQIAAIHRSGGEYVDQGEIILQIQSATPEYILGYLQHPVHVEPKAGMPVLVRRQDRSRVEVISHIEEVGVHLASYDRLQQLFPDQPFQTIGLPLKIAIHPEMDLRPGELVDMRLLIQ